MGAGWRRFSEQVRGGQSRYPAAGPWEAAAGPAAAPTIPERCVGRLGTSAAPRRALPLPQAKQKWHLGGERDFVATPNTR